MLPAVGFERMLALSGYQSDLWPSRPRWNDAANFRDGDSGDCARKPGRWGRREQKFVVLAAVEGLVQGRAGMNGEQSRIHLGCHAGFLAEMGKVSGEAVAEVERGGCESSALQPEALGDARLGIEVRSQQWRKLFRDFQSAWPGCMGFGQLRQAGKSGGGSAQCAGYVEQVADTRAGAQQGFSAGNCAGEHNVGHGDGRFGQVTASERGLAGLGQGQQTVEKPLHPGALTALSRGQLARQSQGKKGCNRPSTHGGQVAQSACQGTMADGFRRVPVKSEVAAGNGQIGGDGQFLAGAGAEQGAVVANAQAQPTAGRLRRAAADLAEQGKFASFAGTSGFVPFRLHPLRIGQIGGRVLG